MSQEPSRFNNFSSAIFWTCPKEETLPCAAAVVVNIDFELIYFLGILKKNTCYNL